MSISTPAWTSTSFFPPPNSSRLWPPVRKKGTLSGNPIKGVREFSAKPERSRTELRAVSYREADVRGRESPDSGIPYIDHSSNIAAIMQRSNNIAVTLQTLQQCSCVVPLGYWRGARLLGEPWIKINPSSVSCRTIPVVLLLAQPADSAGLKYFPSPCGNYLTPTHIFLDRFVSRDFVLELRRVVQMLYVFGGGNNDMMARLTRLQPPRRGMPTRFLFLAEASTPVGCPLVEFADMRALRMGSAARSSARLKK
ncbi:hypothetical protein ALC56_01993 [Trachymyrmex septentrionalis]|uniref:Uncharacterized protein n=1 Tax=Trachymyrmex septentrionalis TaxID=34720 RepID=A0A195FTH8_9HYME|nr:hypothetical protein ALC56_01993 [Trachymyrmex septentrionalis]